MNEKGGLIRKKKKATMRPPAPVKKTQEEDFAYSQPAEIIKQQPIKTKKATKSKTKSSKPKLSVGKSNSTKSLKVPAIIHTEINLLGSFMDENKTYIILQKLIDSYIQNELTDRQRRQFEFMVESFDQEDK